MSDYQPTLEHIREHYATCDEYVRDPEDREAGFDRWLAEHDRQTAEQAWARGYQEGINDHCDADDCDISRSNPYRQEQTKGAEILARIERNKETA